MTKILFTNVILLRTAFLLLIVVVEGSPAQTTVCNGDSVVLVFNGYKQGSSVWKQSPDRTNWFNAQGTSSNDSLVVIATNTLYYCAIVTDGTCSHYYSDTIMITIGTFPFPPTANSASNIVINSFDANWTSSTGATTYYIDVATDAGFTAFVDGYNNLNVGNVITYKVVGLTGSTKYYYRVRASNSCPSNNSDTILVTTAIPVYCTVNSTCSGNITDARDSKIYKTVQIGSQCWMAENLNMGNRIDGNNPQTSGADNQNTSIEKYCYGDIPINCNTYGGLYLWSEMMAYGLSDSITPGPRGICPAGWHIPTDDEWKCMEMNLGMTMDQADGNRSGTNQGGKLKKDTILWRPPNTGATNSSGFNALPGGFHNYDGLFGQESNTSYWWTATEYDTASAWNRSLYYNDAHAYREVFGEVGAGFSVRCVKD